MLRPSSNTIRFLTFCRRHELMEENRYVLVCFGWNACHHGSHRRELRCPFPAKQEIQYFCHGELQEFPVRHHGMLHCRYAVGHPWQSAPFFLAFCGGCGILYCDGCERDAMDTVCGRVSGRGQRFQPVPIPCRAYFLCGCRGNHHRPLFYADPVLV